MCLVKALPAPGNCFLRTVLFSAVELLTPISYCVETKCLHIGFICSNVTPQRVKASQSRVCFGVTYFVDYVFETGFALYRADVITE